MENMISDHSLTNGDAQATDGAVQTNGNGVSTNGTTTTGTGNAMAMPPKEILPTAFVRRPLKIIMLGAGVSGIQFAHDVQTQMSDVELEIYEKNPTLGGTWYENRYPGCACDVPAHTYQFAWEPNPRWSKFYAPAPEILAYLNRVVDKHGLRRYMHFSHECVHAAWHESTATWGVHLQRHNADGTTTLVTRTCDVFVQGIGTLNNWKWPDIEGLHDFQGTLLHTANWDASVDLAGKTIAVIGNGASAVQCVAALQPDVHHLWNYVRTSSWMLPHPFSKGVVQSDYTAEDMERWEADPALYFEFRRELEKTMGGGFAALWRGSVAQDELRTTTLAHMARTIQDPAVRKALEPDFEIGCRRFTPGDHYLHALHQPNCTIVTDRITRVTAAGIVDATGCERALDAIVCCTGFDATYEPRFPTLGRDGYPLSANWGKDKTTESYMGALVARFPNMFVFLAPICPVIGSAFPGIEATSSYIRRIIERLQVDKIRALAVKEEAQTEFNQWAQGRMQEMAFSGNCKSWYKNAKGKVFIPWPGTVQHYLETTKIIRWEDFAFVWADKNKFASLGNGVTRDGFAPEYPPWLPKPEHAP